MQGATVDVLTEIQQRHQIETAKHLQRIHKREQIDKDDYNLNKLDQTIKVRLAQTQEEYNQLDFIKESEHIRQARQDLVQQIGHRAIILTGLNDQMDKDEILRGMGVQAYHPHYNLHGQLSHAVVEFATAKEAQEAATKIHGTWIGAKKLKVITTKDRITQKWDNRTVIVGNLPRFITKEQIIDIFAYHGNIVEVEMPVEDMLVEQVNEKSVAIQAKNKLDLEKEWKERRRILERYLGKDQSLKEYDTTLNEMIKNKQKYPSKGEVEGSLMERLMEYENGLRKRDLQTVTKSTDLSGLQAISRHRQQKVFSVTQNLIQERAMIDKARAQLAKWNDQLATYLNTSNTSHQPTIVDESNLHISNNQISNLKQYINLNSELLPGDLVSRLNKQAAKTTTKMDSDIVAELQVKLDQELAYTLDALSEAYKVRLNIVNHRISRMLQYDDQKHPLVGKVNNDDPESFDWDSSLTPGVEALDIEDLVSINEQINKITEKQTRKGEDIPFDHLPTDRTNFMTMLEKSTPSSDGMTQVHAYVEDVYDQDFDLLEAREHGFENQFDTGFMQQVQQRLDFIKDRTDIPFDDLYHREKGLVDRVVQLELDLKEAQDQPYHKFIGATLDELYAQDPEYFQEEVEYFTGNRPRSEFEDQDAYDEYILQRKENNRFNKGYCFITYSHNDEAKTCMLESENFVLEDSPLDFWMKGDYEHSDFDTEYLQARMKLDARMLQIEDELEQAKDDLKQFENHFQDYMPQMRRVKEFKETATAFLAESQYKDRRLIKRSKQQDEILKIKLEELSRQTGIDYSPLLDSVIENVNDKREAFELYKEEKFSFLKKKREESDEPKQFNWPDLDESIGLESHRVYLNYHNSNEHRYGRNSYQNMTWEEMQDEFANDALRTSVYDQMDYGKVDRGLYKFEEHMKSKFPVEDVSEVLRLKTQIQKEEDHYDRFYNSAKYRIDPTVAQKLKIVNDELTSPRIELDFEHDTHQIDKQLDEALENDNNGELDNPIKFYQTYTKIAKGRNSQKWRPKDELDAKAKKANQYRNLPFEKVEDQHFSTQLQQKRKEIKGQERADQYKRKKRQEYERPEDNPGYLKLGLFQEEKVEEAHQRGIRGMEDVDVEANERFLYRQHMQQKTIDGQLDQTAEQSADYVEYDSLIENEDILLRKASEKLKYSHNLSTKPIGREFRDSYERGFVAQGLEDVDEPEPMSLHDISRSKAKEQQESEVDTEFERLKTLAKKRLQTKTHRNSQSREQDRFEYVAPSEIRGQQQSELRRFLAKIESGTATKEDFDSLFPNAQIDNKVRRNRMLMGAEKSNHFKSVEIQRLQEEKWESIRRQAIIDGKCTEQDSVKWLEAYLEKEIPIQQKHRQVFKDIHKYLQDNQNEGMVPFEDDEQYYFDPNLGVSLEEHIAQIKQVPGVKVETRVDRDGFIIVRKTMQNPYSVKADRVLDQSPQQVKKEILDILEQADIEMNPETVLKMYQNTQHGEQVQNPKVAQTLVQLYKQYQRGDISQEETEKRLHGVVGEGDMSLKQFNGLYNNIQRAVESDFKMYGQQYMTDLYEQTARKKMEHRANNPLQDKDFVTDDIDD